MISTFLMRIRAAHALAFAVSSAVRPTEATLRAAGLEGVESGNFQPK